MKTAIAGSDPNWGRILSAAGNAGVAFDPAKTDIHMQGVAVCQGGLAAPFSEQELKTKAGRRGLRNPAGHSREGKRRSALLDLRPDGRVHPDQRQLPDLT